MPIVKTASRKNLMPMQSSLTKYSPRKLAEEGTTLVEYGLLIAGIALALLLVFNILGQQINSLADLIQNQSQ